MLKEKKTITLPMIDPQELRIGNYLLYYRQVHQVTGIEKDPGSQDYYIRTQTCLVDIKLFLPIAITEEWLIRFGFTTDKASPFYEKSGFYLSNYEPLAGWEMWTKYKNDFVFIAPCYYVHQLQNIFYALTRNPLT